MIRSISCEEKLRVPREERGLCGACLSLEKTLRESVKRMEPGSFQCCPVMDQKQWAQTETGGSEHTSSLWGWVSLAQVSQAGCGVSLLGDYKKPSGQGPGHWSLGGPACTGNWTGWPLEVPSSLSWFVILWRWKLHACFWPVRYNQTKILFCLERVRLGTYNTSFSL